mmetsp:Transcript_8363/g.24010  ORF Transcript_8363/g.24010 Transcript_8363/m.24010 type:complete len:238 (-) Transcript_8363:2187-2900(-)
MLAGQQLRSGLLRRSLGRPRRAQPRRLPLGGVLRFWRPPAGCRRPTAVLGGLLWWRGRSAHVGRRGGRARRRRGLGHVRCLHPGERPQLWGSLGGESAPRERLEAPLLRRRWSPRAGRRPLQHAGTVGDWHETSSGRVAVPGAGSGEQRRRPRAPHTLPASHFVGAELRGELQVHRLGTRSSLPIPHLCGPLQRPARRSYSRGREAGGAPEQQCQPWQRAGAGADCSEGGRGVDAQT